MTNKIYLIHEKDLPEKELHRHDSIPCYVGDEDNGCITCMNNKLIDLIKSKLQPADNLLDRVEVDVDKFSDYLIHERKRIRSDLLQGAIILFKDFCKAKNPRQFFKIK